MKKTTFGRLALGVSAVLLATISMASAPARLAQQQLSPAATSKDATEPSGSTGAVEIEETKVIVLESEDDSASIDGLKEAVEALKQAAQKLAESSSSEDGQSTPDTKDLQSILESAASIAEQSLERVLSSGTPIVNKTIVMSPAGTVAEADLEIQIEKAMQDIDVATKSYVDSLSEVASTQRAWTINAADGAKGVSVTMAPQLLIAPEEFATQGKGAFLGITMVSGSSEYVEVASVIPDSGAQSAGIKTGDRILSIGPVRLDSFNSPQQALVNYLQGVEPGSKVKLKIERDGNTKSITVVASSRPSRESLTQKLGNVWDDAAKSFRYFGGPGEDHLSLFWAGHKLKLAPMNEGLSKYFGSDSGVLVLENFRHGDLQAGDVITEIDGKQATDMHMVWNSIAHASSRAGGSELPVTVMRDGKKMELILRLGQ